MKKIFLALVFILALVNSGYSATHYFGNVVAETMTVGPEIIVLDNSSSDDAAAILAALETIKTSGGTLYLLPGIYNMTSRLNLEDYHGVHIVGVSRDKTILKRGYFGNENAVIRFAGGEHNSIENLTIDCDGWQGRGILYLITGLRQRV